MGLYRKRKTDRKGAKVFKRLCRQKTIGTDLKRFVPIEEVPHPFSLVSAILITARLMPWQI